MPVPETRELASESFIILIDCFPVRKKENRFSHRPPFLFEISGDQVWNFRGVGAGGKVVFQDLDPG